MTWKSVGIDSVTNLFPPQVMTALGTVFSPKFVSNVVPGTYVVANIQSITLDSYGRIKDMVVGKPNNYPTALVDFAKVDASVVG